MKWAGGTPGVLDTVARLSLAVSLVAVAAMKVPLILHPHGDESAGLSGLLRSQGAQVSAVLVECVLGVLVVTPACRVAVMAVQYWLAGLAGVLAAVIIAGEPVSACGCFGPRHAGLAVRLAVLAGLAMTAEVVRAAEASNHEAGSVIHVL